MIKNDIIGDWGMGNGDWAQIPSPFPNPHLKNSFLLIKKINFIL